MSSNDRLRTGTPRTSSKKSRHYRTLRAELLESRQMMAVDLVSKPDIGPIGTGNSGTSISTSQDGSRVAFISSNSSLVTGDTNGIADVFVKDLTTREVTRIVRANGTQITGAQYGAAAISGNGRFVAFSTNVSLAAGDTNNRWDVYRKDLTTGAIDWVSCADGNVAGTGGVAGDRIEGIAISDNGQYVTFSTTLNGLIYVDITNPGPPPVVVNLPQDTLSGWDVYRKNMAVATNSVDLVTRTNNAIKPTRTPPYDQRDEPLNEGSRQLIAMSGDGQVVAFTANTKFITSADIDDFTDVYVRNFASPTEQFATVHSIGNGQFGANGAQGTTPQPVNGPIALSRDGQFLFFSTAVNNFELLLPFPQPQQTNLYRRDLSLFRTDLVSKNALGFSGNGATNRGVASSDDGRFVAFISSASNLTNDDVNVKPDVFVRDMTLQTVRRVNRGYLGNDPVSTLFTAVNTNAVAISGDGTYIVFSDDSNNLTPDDQNGSFDVFRVSYDPDPIGLSIDQANISSPEGTRITNTGEWFVNDAGSDVELTVDLGEITKNEDGTWEWVYTPVDDPAGNPDPYQLVTITSTNGSIVTKIEFGLQITNVAPISAGISGPATSLLGSATYTLLAIDDPGSIDKTSLKYSFSLTSGGLASSYATATSTSPSQSFTFATTGTYTIFARVYDKDGGISPTYTFDTVVSDNRTLGVSIHPSDYLLVRETRAESHNLSISQSGNDLVVVSNNDNVFYLESAVPGAVISPDGKTLTVDLSSFSSPSVLVSTGGGGDVIDVLPTYVGTKPLSLATGDGDDFITIAGTVAVVGTRAGNDTVTVTSTGLVTGALRTEAGDDKVTINRAMNGRLELGEGNDLAVINALVRSGIYAGAGNDEIYGSSQADFIDGGTGDDAINGRGGPDVILGGAGNDRLAGGNNSVIFGEGGNDQLYATAGNAILIGGAGLDALRGGTGYNVMIGGVGSDNLVGAGAGSLLLGERVVYETVFRDTAGNVTGRTIGSTVFIDNTTTQQNAANMRALLAVWAAGGSLDARVSQLRAGWLTDARIGQDLAADSLTLGPATSLDAYFQYIGDTVEGVNGNKKKAN